MIYHKLFKNYNLDEIDKLKNYSFIAFNILLLFLLLHRISPPNWNYWKGNKQYIDPRKGSWITELYIFMWITFELAMFFSPIKVYKLMTWIFAYILIGYRILDIIQSGVNVTIFKDFIIKEENIPPMVSPHRSLIISVMNYIELILCFALIYKVFPLEYFLFTTPKINFTKIDALYFSIVTQLTIGYGDIVPNNNSIKFIIAGQGILGFFFALLVLAIFINILGSKEKVTQNNQKRRRIWTSENSYIDV